jgi:hypothetical protein
MEVLLMTLSKEDTKKDFPDKLPKKTINRTIAYYNEEILDAWLNIGKHEADEKDPTMDWQSWRSDKK